MKKSTQMLRQYLQQQERIAQKQLIRRIKADNTPEEAKALEMIKELADDRNADGAEGYKLKEAAIEAVKAYAKNLDKYLAFCQEASKNLKKARSAVPASDTSTAKGLYSAAMQYYDEHARDYNFGEASQRVLGAIPLIQDELPDDFSAPDTPLTYD